MSQYEDFLKWQADKNGLAAQSTGVANTNYNYNQVDTSGALNFDNRTDGTLYKQGGDTMVSGTLWDSKAGMNDYIKAGDYTGAKAAGYGGDESAFKGLNAAANQSWDYKDWGTAGSLGLGAGQLGLGLASYFDTAKTAKIQRNLLNQQYASNAEAIADRQANKEALSKIVIK